MKQNVPVVTANEVFIDIFNRIKASGQNVNTRTGGVRKVNGLCYDIDMKSGDPIMSLKHVFTRGMIGELLWFMNGETNLQALRKRSDMDDSAWTIWTDDFVRWGGENNEFGGRLYGEQFRNSGGDTDQLRELLINLQLNPYDRDHYVVFYNPSDVKHKRMALKPCHTSFQVDVNTDGSFDLIYYQRSVDTFLGLPFNLASYGLLMRFIELVTGYTANMLKVRLGNVHIYNNHEEQMLQLVGNKDKAKVYRLELPNTFVDKFPMLLQGASEEAVTSHVDTCLRVFNEVTAADVMPMYDHYEGVEKIKAPLSVGS